MKFDLRNLHNSRRSFLGIGAAAAAGTIVPPLGAQSAQEVDIIERSSRRRADPKHRILLKGGTIVSLDAKVGDLAIGDLLIEGTKIAAIGPNLQASGEIIDASNTILIPGFVDCHRHAWEGVLRRIIPNGAIGDYRTTTHEGFARYYRPHDIYVGNLLTALGCIDAGVTCFIDNSHNSRSGAHSDAAIQALVDSGIRSVHASGEPQAGNWDHQWPADLVRLQKKFFASRDQLVTLRMMSQRPDRNNYMLARKLGLEITTELTGAQIGPAMDDLANAKLLGPDVTFNHCNGIPETSWQHIVDSGGRINVCPRSDSQYGIGEGISALQLALDRGLHPGLSVDNETSYGTDMFTEMRVAFYIQRALATSRKVHGDANSPRFITVQELLECATIHGANNAGLADKCGTLVPGKEADIVMIRTDEMNIYPSNHAIGTVVQAADTKNVDTVIIGGSVRKFRGKMIGINSPKLRQQVDESRNYLFQQAGYKLDIFGAQYRAS
jgi:cytosine/adenosine deaminase-related metal-dependent hydrolase